jgi:hypothetical protein
MMIIIKILRRGCFVKKFKRYMARIPFEGGGRGGGSSVLPVVQG